MVARRRLIARFGPLETRLRRRVFGKLFLKYRDRTMLTKEGYLANLELVSTVKASGCVIECGVWKGGTSAGMAEVLGPDREYFLFDSFQGHLDPQPIDGPAAFAWKADKNGPWYFDNAVVAPEMVRNEGVGGDELPYCQRLV